MKTVLITGITGQLSAYLSKLFIDRGYKVVGLARRSANWNPWRLKAIGTHDKIQFETFDLADQSSIDIVVEKHKPDFFINTAAQSFVGSSWDIGTYTLDVTGIGVYRCLEAIRKFSPHTRFLQMSSSELFGNNPNIPYDEKSLFMPRSPYGIAKAVGFYSVTNFRESYDLFASNLISFNFESPLRGEEFVTKKIVKEAVSIVNAWNSGTARNPLKLGNLTPTRDWIWAGDTARAVDLILHHNTPDDFCIASGVTTSVKEFCNLTFKALGHELTWTEVKDDDIIEAGVNQFGVVVVTSNRSLYRPADVPHLIGNAKKANETLGWKASKSLAQIIEEMVNFEQTHVLVG